MRLICERCGIRSSAAKSSVSVELLVFSFFFIDVEMKDTFPSEAVPPVYIMVLGWTPKEPSTHHLTILVESALKIRGRVGVARKYLIKRTSLVQSSSSVKSTLVVRNATAVWMLGRARLVANRVCAVNV